MSLANPAGLLLLLLAIPIIALHILRPRRTEQVVSSTMLWERMDRPVTSAVPWQRFTPSWLLFLQLLAVALLAIAVANPQTVTEAPLANHTVFLVDASGSMAAIDGEPDRLADARERAISLRSELPDGGVASLVEIGPVPRVLLTTSSDADEFGEAVGRIDQSPGAADFSGAFSLAEGLETPDSPIGFVFISDGGLTEEQRRLVPPGTSYERIGADATNRAITDMSVEARGAGIKARVTVAHTGGPEATQTLRVDVDGRTAYTTELTLARNDIEVVEVDLPLGDRVEAFLEGEDLLAVDNRRWAVTSRRAALDVIVIAPDGEADPFLVALLESLDGISVEVGSALPPDHAANAVIFDRVAVPADPGAPFWAIASPGGAEGVDVTGSVELPIITLVRTDNPLLRDLDLTEVGIAEAQQVELTGAEQLVAAEAAPLLVTGEQAGYPFVYLAFPISRSNLPVQIAYPILGDRIVADLGGSALPPTDLVVGRPLSFVGESATITDPAGRSTNVPSGVLPPVADQPGFWTIEPSGAPRQLVAVNADSAESALTPAAAIPSELREARPGEEAPQDRSSWRPWIFGALLAVLVLEYLLARRRVGVPTKQWRWSLALRGLIALALLGALANLGFDQTEDRVATVFVIDGSDSLGIAGRAEATDWVESALRDEPEDSLAGVILFGGDARIEALVQDDLIFNTPTVRIDPSRTDLAAALRLGAAVLPNDARKRVVLLSDGRATTGDALTEARRLAEQGVTVDVRTIGGIPSADAAVTAVDVPGSVRDGEAVPIEADIEYAGGGDVSVSLLRDGALVDARVITIEGDRATVRFVDADPPQGLHRYAVEVRAADDIVLENNTAFAPVQVAAAAGVLIIEGEPGNAATLTAALESTGTAVTVESPAAIDTVESLIVYDAIVLVDVARSDLTSGQIDAVTSAVRDTGRGLVTIGGTRSYGLGGYLGSDLEDVLPVISDVLDPQRRQTVAEVFAIDTSGSMGSCHCAEGFGGNDRTPGGVNKTDIARAGAARSIAALSASDEVGVLAFDDTNRWVLDLQPVPDSDVVNDALGVLQPDGGTDLRSTLTVSAEQLRASDAAIKHIVLFSDGFTDPAALDAATNQARELFENEGITVSVIATGEGAARELQPIALAGGGRFYPGRDLNRIPEILLEESLIASRDFVVEGEFLPIVTSNAEVVEGLTASPPLLGYVATTVKPPATTLLRIGDDEDPLLATWQIGLGQATSWTSDSSARWSQLWASWDGYAAFWTRVVRDTFPTTDEDVATSATVSGETLTITVDSADAFGDGAVAMARLTGPDGEPIEVPLNRVNGTTFSAEVTIEDAGIYAVGSSVTAADGSQIDGTALTSRSYSIEYRPGSPDESLLRSIAEITGGRTQLTPEQAFDTADLEAGTTRFHLLPWLLLFAVIAWPIAVALSRLSLRRSKLAVATPTPGRTTPRLRRLARKDAVPKTTTAAPSPDVGAAQPPPASSPPSQDASGVDAAPPPPPTSDAPATTLDALLSRKRDRDDPEG